MTLRVAMVGMGAWGRRLAEKLDGLAEFELTGVFDADETKTVDWVPRTRVFRSEAELLASDVEAVCVAVDPEHQGDVGRRVLEAGKSLFVEKPCAVRPDVAASLAASARAQGLVVGVGHLVRYGESHALIAGWLRDLAAAGPILRGSFRRSGARPRRVHALWVLGPHEASRLLAWFPGARLLSSDLSDDAAVARLEDEGGAALEVFVSSSGPSERFLRIEGARGFVEFDEATGLARRELVTGEGALVLREERSIVEDRLAEQLRAFARSVRTGERLPTDADEGLRVTELLHRIETLGKRTSTMVPSRTPTRRTPSTSKAIEYSRS